MATRKISFSHTRSSSPSPSSKPNTSPKPDGSLFGSSNSLQLQQFQEQPGRFLDPNQEMRRQLSFGQLQGTQQLGLASSASQFGAGLGQSAAAAQQRREQQQDLRDRLSAGQPVRTLSLGSASSGKRQLGQNLELMSRQARLDERQASRDFARNMTNQRFGNYYNSLANNQNFDNQLRGQRVQNEASLREALLQSSTQLGQANIGAQANMFGSTMGALGNIFGSISAGGGSGRYW